MKYYYLDGIEKKGPYEKEELKNYNMLEYNLFKRAQIAFPSDEQMNLTLPDSVISREKSGILVEYLEKVFCERCGMNLKIQLDFQEMQL